MSALLDAKKHEAAVFDRQFTEEAANRPCNTPCTRQDFERRNSRADATKEISGIDTPVFILMGKDDRNVDPDETVAVWRKALPVGTARCIRQLPGQLTGFYAANGLIINLPLSGLCGNRDCFCCPGNTPIRPGHLILSHHGSLSSNVGTELPSYYLPKAKQGVTKKSPLFHKTRCVHQVVVYR